MPVLPSYKNKSIDLLCKSMDWFLYEGNTGISWVKNWNEMFINQGGRFWIDREFWKLR